MLPDWDIFFCVLDVSILPFLWGQKVNEKPKNCALELFGTLKVLLLKYVRDLNECTILKVSSVVENLVSTYDTHFRFSVRSQQLDFCFLDTSTVVF